VVGIGEATTAVASIGRTLVGVGSDIAIDAEVGTGIIGCVGSGPALRKLVATVAF
jgi:hypothetical protein